MAARSDWRYGPHGNCSAVSSDAIPKYANARSKCSAASATSRAWSVSSMRTKYVPPVEWATDCEIDAV